MKMKRIVPILIALLFIADANAQPAIDTVLGQIEQNSSYIEALKSRLKSDRMQGRVGIFPENPEFEYGYQWGDPASMGNKVVINASQTIDFPTAYLYRSGLIGITDSIALLRYELEVRRELHTARKRCIEVIFHNALIKRREAMLANAEKLLAIVKRKLDIGEASLIDYRRAALVRLNSRKRLQEAQVNRDALLMQLATMNGGKPVRLSDTLLPLVPLPPDAETWLDSVQQVAPQLLLANQQRLASERNVKLQRALTLPKVKLGYASEKVANEQFRGMVVGLTIPLWANRASLKRAKLQRTYSARYSDDVLIKFRGEQRMLYLKAKRIAELLKNYRNDLVGASTVPLMFKAVESGELSVVDFLTEFSLYYDSYEELLQLERDYCLSVAELTWFMPW